jgi:hypothetical protein
VDRAEPVAESPAPDDVAAEGDVLPANHPPIGDQNAGLFDSLRDDPKSTELPANHPPIDQPHGVPGTPAQEADAPPAITWKAPAKWSAMPNPNTMRLATYRVPAAAGAEDGELTVVRAGGSTEANFQRWVGQFENAGPASRAETSVHGHVISTIEVSGTFRGGGMTAAGPAAGHPGFTLLGAVVETEQGPYFFKLTGPSATVRAARTDFDALVNSIAPAASGAR